MAISPKVSIQHYINTLGNGLRVVTIPMPHARSVSVRLFVGAGSRYEERRINGITHFIEHLLFKGTTKRPTPRDISSAIESLGGHINASTGLEMTSYYAKVLPEHVGVAFDVLSDMLLNARLDAKDVESEKGVVLQEIHRKDDRPDALVHVLFNELLWPDNPLGRPVLGDEQTITDLTRDEIVAYIERLYSPTNVVACVAGDIETAKIVDLADKFLGGMKPKPTITHEPSPPKTPGPVTAKHPKATEQTHLCLGMRAYSRSDPERFPAQVLGSILGGGMSSRLFLNIRERKSLAYDIYSHASSLSDTGDFLIYAGLDSKKVDLAIESILQELSDLRHEQVPKDELSMGKERQKGPFLFHLESTENVANYYGAQVLLVNEVMTPEERLKHLDAVTAEDVQAIANDLFIPENLLLAAIGTDKTEEDFAEMLQGLH